MKQYPTLKIEYSKADKNKFRILLIDDESVISSKELTSLDAARLHHVLTNIEPCLRNDMTLTTEQLSGITPLLMIKESQVILYINRLEISTRHDTDTTTDTFYFTFKCFDDIDKIKNYFAEAQY